MNDLLHDLWLNVQGYYEDLVDLLPRLLVALAVFLLFGFVANRVRRLAARSLDRRMDDPLLARFLAGTIRAVIIIIALLFVLKIVGLGATAAGLLASAGVGAFVIGFAFKDIGENFLAGIMLAFNRPFKVGDLVELGGIKGKVTTLSLRNVQIKTNDGRDVFIPNAKIVKEPVTNFTVDGNLRYDFTIGLDYGSDIPGAITIIQTTLRQITGILQGERAPTVAVANLGSSTLDLTIYYWTDAFDPNVSAVQIKNQAVVAVLAALGKAGYYLPADIVEMRSYRDKDIPQTPK